MANEWVTTINQQGTPCCKCDGLVFIPKDAISYTLNRARNAVNRILLRGQCPNVHCTHICPHCYSSFQVVRDAISCMEGHIMNGTNICPSGCTWKCRTYQDWMRNHYMQDPNFSKQVPRSKNQERRRIQDEISGGTLTSTLYDLISLRESPFMTATREFNVDCPSRLLDHDCFDNEWTCDWDIYEESVEPISKPSNDVSSTGTYTIHNHDIMCAIGYSLPHSFICSHICREIQHLPEALPKQVAYHPWLSKNQMDFTIKYYIQGGMTDAVMSSFLKDLHFTYSTGGVDIPQSLHDMKSQLKMVPQLKPYRIEGCPHTPLFRLKDILSNVMTDTELVSQMEFGTPQVDTMSEVWHSPSWKNIIDEMKRSRPGTLPIIIMLFYDDFRKFKMAAGSCGGLYMAILNLPREVNSKPRNIFCLGLINSEQEYNEVMSNIVTQLRELWLPHYSKIGDKGEALVSVRLAMFLADTPQRNETCGIKNHNAICFCHQCMMKKSMGIDPSTTAEIRNVPEMRRYSDLHHQATTQTEKNDIERKYGLKPCEAGRENPFYSLFDLYGFDIFQDSPVDLFHVTIIGLLPTTISLINSKIPNAKVALIEGALKELSVGDALSWNDCKFWNGDKWLKFLSIAPFLYSKVLDDTNDIECAFYVCLLRLFNWIRMIMKRRMKQSDIDEAQNEWTIWIKEMVELFPHDNLANKPNFHNSSHVFEFARRWGPPILYWARPFEHKHRTFKTHISHSNFKNVVVWCANRDALIQSIRFVYPHYNRKKDGMDPNIVGMIQFWSGNVIMYGEVVEQDSSEIELLLFSFHLFHSRHYCPIWSSREVTTTLRIKRTDYIGQLHLQKVGEIEYVNHFLLLNLVKK